MKKVLGINARYENINPYLMLPYESRFCKPYWLELCGKSVLRLQVTLQHHILGIFHIQYLISISEKPYSK